MIHIINIIAVLIVVLCISHILAFYLLMMNVPYLLVGILCFSIGLFLPKPLIKWLYKEDNKE